MTIRPCLKIFHFHLSPGAKKKTSDILKGASFLISGEKYISSLPFFFSSHPFARRRLLN
jgi:hypothetical protein